MTAAPQSVSAVLPIKRREWPRWSYWPARALALGLLWPIFKCFEWYGSWPRALGRGFTRRMFAVGRIMISSFNFAYPVCIREPAKRDKLINRHVGYFHNFC
jgi:hypothetical protein